MASLATLNENSLLVINKEIVEPIAASQTIAARLEDYFPENLYSHSKNGFLYKFLTVLLGDAGVNSFKKAMLYPRLSNSIYNTHFSDIDKFYGSIFGFTRIDREIYTYNPFEELLDEDAWQEVRRKDSWYRSRCLEYMRGIQLGTTNRGIALACKAASGIDCTVIERWRYLDDQISDETIGVVNYGTTGSRQEFIIVPHVAKLTPKEERRISNVLHKIKPADSIFSIQPQEKPRVAIPPKTITGSSKYFQAKRLVTGNKSIKYPPVDTKTGLWIEPGVEKEAPTFAFGGRQEFITWPSIVGATASSSHVGPFNQLQRELFPHLNLLPSELYQYDPRQAYLDTPVLLEITQPWISRNNYNQIVNNHFPLSYFADPNTPFPTNEKLFWSSKEALPPESETLTLEFNNERTFNFIEFEVGTKPIRFTIEAFVDGVWEEVSYQENALIDSTRQVLFTSSSSSWQQMQILFEAVEARFLRINFTRGTDTFPYPQSPAFEWSIDVRGLRVGNIVTTLDDFVGTPDPIDSSKLIGDTGIDILGNNYRTVIEPDRYAPEKVADDDISTFWQSQANPSKFAVESLYFDISDDNDNPQTINEIYIDPITSGCLMHIYWSNDDPDTIPPFQEAEDWRLWTPVPRHYILTEGYHSLKQNITAKYIKIEFTKLLPLPYRALEVSFKPIRYKTHPSWVQEFIYKNTDFEEDGGNITFVDNEVVNLDYILLGIYNPEFTKLDEEEALNIEDYISKTDLFQRAFANRNLSGESDEQVRIRKESNINIHLNLFRENLINTLTPDQFFKKFLLNSDLSESFIPEIPLVDIELFDIASRNDRLLVEAQKHYPDMWFPRTARHAYKILDVERFSDIAYNVAIREVKFYRTDSSAASDDILYSDTLADDINIEDSTFLRADWRFIVSDEYLGEGTGSIGDENFDIFTPDRIVS